MKSVKKLLIIFDRKRKIQYLFLVIMMLIGAAFETIGVSAIMPMISAIATPDTIGEGFTGLFYRAFGKPDVNHFVIYMGIFIIIFYVIKDVYLTVMNYIQLRYIFGGQRDLGMKMYDIYINMPYEFYVNNNLSKIARKININVGNAFSYLMNFTQLVTQIVTASFIIVYLFTVDWIVTLTIVFAMLMMLGVIKLFVTPFSKKAGKYSREAGTKMSKWIRQTIEEIKDIKIGKHQDFFKFVYNVEITEFTDNQRSASIWNRLPSFGMEVLAISGIMVYFFVLIATGHDIINMLSVLGVFAMAVIKMLPCASTISGCISGMSFYEPAVIEMTESILIDKKEADTLKNKYRNKKELIEFKKCIEMNNVWFEYKNRNKLILKGASLIVPVNASVGIKGSSGAGKSTALDILLGILEPQQGNVTVDEIDIRDCYDSYISKIGYISQTIYLMDDTIRRNVAIGRKDDEIDDDIVWRVLEEAQLGDFVRELENGLDTIIGDRALKLSGGQRQRMGIARALYDEPEILVFDEATSSLDNETEAAIMESINNMKGKHTMIIVAHRLNTIEGCDMIYNVHDGIIERER